MAELFFSMIFTIVLWVVFLVISLLFKTWKESFEKGAAVESGFLSFMSEKNKFSMQFFMILLLFIIFDAEFIFIFFSPFLLNWFVFLLVLWVIYLTLFFEWKLSKMVWF